MIFTIEVSPFFECESKLLYAEHHFQSFGDVVFFILESVPVVPVTYPVL